MRREPGCDVSLGKGRGRAQDQIGITRGFSHIRRHQRQPDLVAAVDVLEKDARAGLAMRFCLRLVTPPEPDLVACKRKIARGRE